ncbi:type VI secretion system-associated FHA domain protein TagH [Aminobacter sp. HY435]|uniref:type VI secretion system-associated FHA domain protein TagH n=1 Tax=Aminobacter sp. HY435 TaxID=2970917 RepID=UPI0022B9758B|nr:type VI secretion system-associated FHA domain protein TagH [Aminobacter sp. HY435]
MSLLLTLEQGPRAQAVRQARLDTGELVIGRSPEADWQIDDPDMFVSRAHCRISSRPGGYIITDTSSSGLFIDGAGSPLGAGNSAELHDGMRLRLGDYVVGVELPESAASVSVLPSASRAPVSIGSDDFFATKSEEEPQRPRPADLPSPFEQPDTGAFRAYERSDGRQSSPAFDDPFSLDPVATPSPTSIAEPEAMATAAFNDPFGLGSPEPVGQAPVEPPRQHITFDDEPALRAPPSPPSPAPTFKPEPASERRPRPWERPVRHAESPSSPPQGQPPPKPVAPPRNPSPSDEALRAAFLRGVGLDDASASSRDPIAEMEKFGREYRLMMDGLMQLLRKRAEEKGNARIEQTVVGSSEVNPLKFLPTVDDVLGTIMAERSPGFLAGEPAIKDAIRDLAHHHIRAWRGLQGALRRMIDRFDPAALEAELKSSSSFETLLAGGRSAKLWDIYKKRHREIAQSAETRFMGEIGADFRNAYEEE